MSTAPNSHIPLRSPTPPLDSSSDDLNELSLDQELAQLERPHFLDYTAVGIPYPVAHDDQPPPIPPRHPLTNSLPMNRRSSIPVKMIRSADNVPSYSETNPPATASSSSHSGGSGKKHFLDENPVRPDYDYNRPHRSLDREYERRGERIDNDAIKMPFEQRRQHSADRQKPKKIKEPSYALSRFLENDDSLNQYNDNEVQLSDVNLCANPSEFVDNLISGSDYMYSLLSMIGCNNTVDMSKKFLELSKSPNTCASLRHSRCIPILVQMIHCGTDDLTRKQAREALRNVVNYHPDDKVGRREAKVLRYIEQIMDYCDLLKKFKEDESDSSKSALDSDSHPLQAMCSLMKISFDEEHRHSMCTLGALQTIANLVYYDHAVHGTNPNDTKCISFRRYAGMALTNLTFGDGNNKALLCANHDFMKALVAQINTDADDLLQVTANVLRNLSWRADNNMKTVLNEIGTVTALTLAAMKNEDKENTLRAILSALWNLSAHCSKNKAEFCQVDGALAFLVKMLKHKSDIKTLPIIENAGGILRNVSSHIAVNEDYRKILRQGDCLGILLVQLKSESLTVVSNACGTLWNLSARCPEDQKFLRDNGAISMLRSLIHSKHKMISNGSKVALKNLINFRGEMNRSGLDPVAKSMGLKELPTLSARKQRALEVELDENLSETCENVETTKSPPPVVNHKAPKSFTALDRSHHYSVERNFEQLSLQCNVREPTDHAKSSNLIWDTKPYAANVTNVFNMHSAPQHPTGTIPKRTIQADGTASANATVDSDAIASTSNASNTGKSHKDETIDSDQITNFSLVYCEEGRDVKTQKNRTFSVAEEDTVKCYDNEGTPHLSTATSISDLRPLPKHSAHSHHNMHRNSKSGRTTTENSGINTPEKPINYCEEGTPAYFSRRDSFSSLHEEINEPFEITHKPNQMSILPTHKTNAIELNAQIQPNEQATNLVDSGRSDYEHNSSNNCTVPTTPGESASKTVTFNEFNLETPMMFSRHSSLGSLASHEPPLNDDIGSVVSETSRMPSGIISPSEIPDSPSQTMPQSPRQKHTHSHDNSSTQRHLPFDDEVRTFGVENTPALISTATSLSNLSLDDEPKIANDLLIKEMRLMHHLSDEQDDDPNAIASTSAEINGENVNFNRMESKNCDAGHSDSDDSINDDESLLNNCISIGIQAKNIEPDIKSPPALPEPADILPSDDLGSDDDLDENPADLLEQCIRSGITKKSNKAPSESSGIQLSTMGCKSASRQIIKENPIGMLRKGGNSFIETTYDETNRFDIEDSPCNYSVASGLSDLTVGSHSVGLLRINRLPSIQSMENVQADANSNERALSPLSVNSEEERQLLQQAFAAGQARILSQKQANTASAQCSNQPTVHNVNAPANQNDDDGHSSISSIDSNDSNELLQQCIKFGMTKANQNVQPKSLIAVKSPAKSANSNQMMKRSQLPTPKASTSQLPTPQSSSVHRSRATKRDQDDKQLLMDCINAGIERNIRSKSTVNEKSMPNSPSKRIEMEQMQSMPPTSSSSLSKNVKTTSATVYHTTAGATDVVDNRKGTACVQGQRQRQPAVSNTTSNNNNIKTNTAQTMKSKIVRDQSIHITGDIIAITMTQPTTTTTIQAATEIGYNNSALNTSTLSAKSHNSFNMGGDLSLLERSNEYPACLGQNESIYDSQHSSSVDMEISNECLFENLSPPKIDKHKDPNLMLQSVERLTHELVSTAEYLRTANSNDYDDDVTITDSKITFSNSNNTWNEDTNPNAVPFPSMSRTAPVVDSMHDDDTTISDLNCEGSRYEMANSEFIEDSTPTNNNRTFSESVSSKKFDSNGLHFEIGGKVNQHTAESYNCNGFNSNSTTSTMTNSTIIAMEADKIRNQLIKDNKSDSTISLDKIRPPSVMEKMNHSSYCDSLTAGASSLNRSPARFLAQGFMARRALQSAANNSALGSTDSINSSCNLDRVKPPSIMDDLLDSMISVDSIASEYIDNPPPPQPNEDPSHYETAFSECDDTTVTLKNCADLPYDNTPCGSDFSSAESTPKKGRRSLTPRRKRQLTKERYQTYTISTNNPDGQHSQENPENGPIEGKGIFAMQISNNPIFMNGNDSDAISLVSSDGEVSSLRAFTKNLPYLNDISVHNNDISINTNTYTKQPRGSIQNSLQSTPMPSGDFYDSLPIDNGGTSNASSKPSSPSRTITKSPRIIKPSPANSSMVPAEKPETSAVQLEAEAKVIRGRKKPAYVSPYSIAKLTKTTPQQPKPPVKTVAAPKVEPSKPTSMSKTVENKAKSFIQRSAESLKKMRPTFTSKLTKQSPPKKSPAGSTDKQSLDRQKSSESAKSSETLVRQGTFIKDEPSAPPGDIPVIVSEPTSPKKTKTLVSRIPFNRTTSLQTTTRNVTKSNTNIEIPLQKNASVTFIRRTMKSASSTSQISSPTARGSLSPRQSLDSPSTSKSIFNRWSPPNKKVSPLPTTAAKVSTMKPGGRESIGSTTTAAAPKPMNKVGGKVTTNNVGGMPNKVSKIGTIRTISTNGRTTKV